ncbi:peptidyl-prolyl cis-trans isomerase [Thermodesulfobacteriota bacterium]
MSKKVKLISIFAVVVLFLAALFIFIKKKEKEVVIVPKVTIISMQGQEVFKEDFERDFLEENPHLNLDRGDEYYLNALKREYAHSRAEEMLLKRIAKREKVTVVSEEVTKEIERLMDGYSKMSFNEMLKSEGMTLDELRRLTLTRLILQKVLNEIIYKDITISDDEVSAFYNQFKSSFHHPEQYKIKKITVEDEIRAKEAYEKLKKKEIDFDTATEEYSIVLDPTNIDEQDYIEKSGIPEEFESAFSSLKPGNITNVINTPKGFHILKLEDVKPERIASIDEVSTRIERILREQKEKKAYSIFMNEAKQKYNLYIFDDYFKVKKDEE